MSRIDLCDELTGTRRQQLARPGLARGVGHLAPRREGQNPVEKRNPFRFKIGMMALPKGTISVRNLAYLALHENRPNLLLKPNMWDALRGSSTWRVFYSFVSVKALGRASHKTLM